MEDFEYLLAQPPQLRKCGVARDHLKALLDSVGDLVTKVRTFTTVHHDIYVGSLAALKNLPVPGADDKGTNSRE